MWKTHSSLQPNPIIITLKERTTPQWSKRNLKSFKIRTMKNLNFEMLMMSMNLLKIERNLEKFHLEWLVINEEESKRCCQQLSNHFCIGEVRLISKVFIRTISQFQMIHLKNLTEVVTSTMKLWSSLFTTSTLNELRNRSKCKRTRDLIHPQR